MKIYYSNKNKLILLKLARIKNFKKDCFFFNLSLENIQFRLAKSFKIIYYFIIDGKNFLFLNNSKNLMVGTGLLNFYKTRIHLILEFDKQFDIRVLKKYYKKILVINFINNYNDSFNFKLSYKVLKKSIFVNNKNYILTLLKSLYKKIIS